MSKLGIRVGLLVGATLALSACNGGGGGVPSGGSSGPAREESSLYGDRSLQAYANDVRRLIDNNEMKTDTPPANLPSGSVDYRGVGVILTDPQETSNGSAGVIGKARVTANFDGNSMNARVENFVDTQTGQYINGKMFIRSGSLRDGAITGPITGTLDRGSIRGVGEGGIYGNNGEALAMGTSGSISGGGFDGEFEGAIIGER